VKSHLPGDTPLLSPRDVNFLQHEWLEVESLCKRPRFAVEHDPCRVFAWAVGDPGQPGATWRFTLRPEQAGTMLSQWVRLGPGRSGLSIAIDQMPDKEQKIVFVRMGEFEESMTRTLAAIKALAEQA
jgi:hypothetical protein